MWRVFKQKRMDKSSYKEENNAAAAAADADSDAV